MNNDGARGPVADTTGQLAGRVALVTGSTLGIGRACALRFALEGARLVINDEGRDPTLGEQVVAEIKALGGDAVYVSADVRRYAEVTALVASAIEAYGRLDILMNNAICGQNAAVVELEERDWDDVFNASVKATYVACKHAIPQMMAQGAGVIINTSSVHGLCSAVTDQRPMTQPRQPSSTLPARWPSSTAPTTSASTRSALDGS